MGNSTKRNICAVFLLFTILFSAGCSNPTNDYITLAITEQVTTRHVEQPATTTMQEIKLGDTITFEAWDNVRAAMTIKEIRDYSVLVQVDGSLWMGRYYIGDVVPRYVELQYGISYDFMTPTLSSFVIWTLVFEK